MPSRWKRIWLRAGARTIVDRVVDVGEHPRELGQRAGRDDEARLLDRIEHADRLDGDPVVVGGGQGEPVALEPGEDAGEDRPGLVARRGERHLEERLAEGVLGDPRGRPLTGGRDGREFLGVDALDVGLEPARLDMERVARLELEVDPVAGRQRRDESVKSLAGTVIAPSASILPGTQYVIPISRFVAVSLRPASSVLRRTLARTGRVLRDETARLATARPRARFSCMTDSFTWAPPDDSGRRWVARPGRAGLRRSGWVVIVLSIFSPHHRHHQAVDRGDGAVAAVRASGPWTRPRRGGRPWRRWADGRVDRRWSDPADAPVAARIGARTVHRGSAPVDPTRPRRRLSTPGGVFHRIRAFYPPTTREGRSGGWGGAAKSDRGVAAARRGRRQSA